MTFLSTATDTPLTTVSVKPGPPPKPKRMPFNRPFQIVAGEMVEDGCGAPRRGRFRLLDPATGETYYVIAAPDLMPLLFWVRRVHSPKGKRRTFPDLFFSPATEAPCQT